MGRITDKEPYEYKQRFEEEYKSFVNGNISEFKSFLHRLDGEDIYIFIKWLQEEQLKI